MAKFLGRVLTFLDTLYDIRDSRIATDQLDLTGVQLVHDVGEGVTAQRILSLNDDIALRSSAVEPFGAPRLGTMIFTASQNVTAGTPDETIVFGWTAAIKEKARELGGANLYLVDFQIDYGLTGSDANVTIAKKANAFAPSAGQGGYRVLERVDSVAQALGSITRPDVPGQGNTGDRNPFWDRRPVRLLTEGYAPGDQGDSIVMLTQLNGGSTRQVRIRAEAVLTPASVRLDLFQ